MSEGGGSLGAHVSGWLAPAIGALGAFLGAGLLWLGQRLIGKAAVQMALNDSFAKFTAELRAELQASRSERAELRQTLDSEREERDAERLQSASERASLRGEIINLTQVIEGLKGILREHGIPVPETRARPSVENPPPMMLELPGPPKEEDHA